MASVRPLLVLAIIVAVVTLPPSSTAWSNGGWSSTPSRPDLGTHDLVAVAGLCALEELAYGHGNRMTGDTKGFIGREEIISPLREEG